LSGHRTGFFPPAPIIRGIAAKNTVNKINEIGKLLTDDSFQFLCQESSVAEPHHFYEAPALAPGKNFDAAPAAPAPTLFYSKGKILKRTNV
jgi:hypothetical protein